MILDPALAQQMIADRVAKGIDLWDEVWEGTYMMAPAPNNEHQLIVAKLQFRFQLNDPDEDLQCLGGCNVSDRETDWTQNYRIPDFAVYRRSNPAVNRQTHWVGGPDLAIEIISPGDRSREKIDFYAQVGTQELILIDREPWQMAAYRLQDQTLRQVATVDIDGQAFVSETAAFEFSLRSSTQDDRPDIGLRHQSESEPYIF